MTYLRKFVLTMRESYLRLYYIQCLLDLAYLCQLWDPMGSEDSDKEWHRDWPMGCKVSSLIIAIIFNKHISEGKPPAIPKFLQSHVNWFYKTRRLLSTSPQATLSQPCSEHSAPSVLLYPLSTLLWALCSLCSPLPSPSPALRTVLPLFSSVLSQPCSEYCAPSACLWGGGTICTSSTSSELTTQMYIFLSTQSCQLCIVLWIIYLVFLHL